MIKVPVEFTVAEVKIGARRSGATVELFMVGNSVNDKVSLPVPSCTAALKAVESGVGAV